MARSFFGGNPSKAHYSVSLRYRAHPDESRSEGEARRKAEQATIDEAGFKGFHREFFQFTVGDPIRKAACKRQADALAQKITAATGIELYVAEGFFL